MDKYIEEGLSDLSQEKDIIDEEIYDLLVELNSAGYITSWSCAGHKDSLDWSDGFIHFWYTPESGYSPRWAKQEKDKVSLTVKKYNINNPVFDKFKATKTQRKGIRFAPISKNPVSELYQS